MSLVTSFGSCGPIYLLGIFGRIMSSFVLTLIIPLDKRTALILTILVSAVQSSGAFSAFNT